MRRLVPVVLTLVVIAAVAWFAVGRRSPDPLADATSGQSARSDSQASARSASPTAAPSPLAEHQTRTPIAVKPPPRYEALAAAYAAGALPEPLPLPRGDIDRQASEMASAIFRADESSTAALYGALLASGYGVRLRDGTVRRTITPGLGIVFHEWEVAGMAKLYGLGYGVTIQHLSDAFRQPPAWKEVDVAQLLLRGIHDAAFGQRPDVRFWARFLAELGRRAPEPYDILADPDPAKSRLDAIQISFVLSRFAADYQLQLGPPTPAPPVDLMPALWNRRVPQLPINCTGGDELTSIFQDYVAIAETTVFGLLVEQLGGRFSKYGKAVEKANLVGSVLKFILMYAQLDHHIEIEEGLLVRTKTTTAGETATVKDTITIEDTYANNVNCARQMLNAAGLDVTLPDAGPVENVRVWWTLDKGRDELATWKYQQGSNGGFSYTKKDGVAKAVLQGTPQADDLSRRKIVEIRKDASLRASSQLKSTRMDGLNDVLKTTADFGSLVIAFLTGDVGGGFFGVFAESFYRASWGYSDPYTFTVVDWEPCGNVWSGDITYSESWSSARSAERPGLVRTTWGGITIYNAKTRIFQSRPDAKPSGMSQANASMMRYRNSTGLTACYAESVQLDNASGGGGANAYLSVSVDPSGEYRVGYTLPIVDAEGKAITTYRKKGACNNPFNMSKDTSGTFKYKISPEANLEIEGKVDPRTPDRLAGSRTETREIREGVRTSNVSWTLVRCQ